VEGSTYGLELVYPHEQECRVINEGGVVRFDWDFYKEPAGSGVTGGEFITFFPKAAPGQYLFNTRMDVAAPPGHVLRIEPHPRFFTDLSGEVPAAIIANLQTEWWSKSLFVVFKVPPVGGRHVFRKGEAFAQIIFVPQRASYEVERMAAEEFERRQKLAQDVEQGRRQIATNLWLNKAGEDQTNHYKVMASAFARDGLEGVEALVAGAVARQVAGLPADKSIAECMAQGAALMAGHEYEEARDVFVHVLRRDAGNAEAVLNTGICLVCLGATIPGLEAMDKAVAMRPNSAEFHAHLGEMRRLLGRLEEAEGSFRSSVRLDPDRPAIRSVLGLTVAQRGRGEEGLRICDEALAMNPGAAIVHYRKGLILAGLGQVAAARASYEAALSIDPALGEARRALAELPAEMG
jgi:tetratricopeptide (TPR) repeat protein